MILPVVVGFVVAQAALVVAYGVARGAARLPFLSARHARALARALVVAALVAPLAGLLGPRADVPFAPAVQVWSAPTRRAPPQEVVSLGGATATARALPTPWLAAALALFVGVGLAVSLREILAARGAIGRVVARGRLLRRVGRVRLVASSDVATPFAARDGEGHVVVLDPETLTSPTRRLAIAHELGHVASGDASWALAIAALLAPSRLNPVARAWFALLRDLDELACDEGLLARGVDAASYGRCLLDAALRGRGPALGAGLSASARALGARLERVASPRCGAGWAAGITAIAAGAVVLSVGGVGRAYADRRVSRGDLVAARGLTRAAGLDVPLDPAVVAAVTRLVSTPDGRRFLDAGLARRPALVAAAEAALVARGLPRAFTAVALVESGYANLGPRGPAGGSLAPGEEAGAGVWMFIPATARAYGLVVDGRAATGQSGGRDDRMDVGRETEAAAALLADLMGEFGDAALALAAYNQGAEHVRRAIAAEGTRDALELARRGALNDYAATVLAAALVEQGGLGRR